MAMSSTEDNSKSWRGYLIRVPFTQKTIRIRMQFVFIIVIIIIFAATSTQTDSIIEIRPAATATPVVRATTKTAPVTPAPVTPAPVAPARVTRAPVTPDTDLFKEISLPPIVWKWGLCQLSDVHDSIPWMVLHARRKRNNTPSNITDITLFLDIKDGDLICLPDSQIEYFIAHILPNITSYFSIVSHSAASRQFISRLPNQLYIYENLIRSKYLLKWFVANYDGNINKEQYDYHGKLENIPLGWDFHTPWMMTKMKDKKVFGPHYLGHYNDPYPNYIAISDVLQNRTLIEHNIDHRIHRIFVGSNLNTKVAYGKKYAEYLQYFKDHKEEFDLQTPWFSFVDRFGRKYPYRAGVYSIISNYSKHDIWHMEQHRMEQYEMFAQRSKYVFVLSPFGNGWDCFRTWESILFGHIVIVQSTAGKGVDEMFINHQLPVVIVDNVDAFADIDEKQLEQWYQEYKKLTYFENANTRYKMTNAYWINYMKNKTMSLIP